MEKQNRKEFKKREKQAEEDLSRILNPNNAYKRRQKEILRGIFKR
jgi:hypothetical protein